MTEPREFRFLTTRLADRVLTIALARPEVHNALHGPACQELGEALDHFEDLADAAVAIVTGAGDAAFCAGFDLRWAEAHPEVYRDPLFGSGAVRRERIGKPVIAAVNGLAYGLGFELALACDLIVAARHARFALPEARVGLAAMGGGVVRLTQQIGVKGALAIALTGKPIGADEALRLGIINEVAPAAVMDRAMQWALEIAECGPLSLRATKEMAYRCGEFREARAALDPRSYPGVMQLFDSEDATEGRRAFLEGRKPQWRGR